MAEFIDREVAKAKIREKFKFVPARIEINEVLNSIPAADVRPVARAAWQSWEQDKPPCKWYSCDYCGFHALSKSNFCPNCGCAMEDT